MVAAKPAIATTATTTSALRRVDVVFATSGACGASAFLGDLYVNLGDSVARWLVFRDGLEDCHA